MSARTLLLVFFGLLGAGCSAATAGPPAPSPPAPPAPECKVDTDCACGVDRVTKRCAYGPAAKIDPNVQCPDFCSGIAGHLKIVCGDGKCKQVPR